MTYLSKKDAFEGCSTFNMLYIEKMDPTRTILEIKSAFIWSQVRILSESLDLPEDWRSYAVDTEEHLSDKVIEDVLHKCKSTTSVAFYCRECHVQPLTLLSAHNRRSQMLMDSQ